MLDKLLQSVPKLSKLVNDSVKVYAKKGTFAKLSFDDFSLLSEFDNLIVLIDTLLTKTEKGDDLEFSEAEEMVLFEVLEHGLFQYKLDIDNAIKFERDFSLIQCVESRILSYVKQSTYCNFDRVRMIINLVFRAGMSISESLLSEINDDEFDNRDELSKDNYEMMDLTKAFENMLNDIGVDSEYDIYQLVSEQLYQLPAAAIELMMVTLMRNENAVSRDAALLLLLHPLEKTRNVGFEYLLELANQGLLKHKDYKRLTIIRHWVTAKQKALVDQTIKQLQRASLVQDISPLEVDPIYKIHTSAIDASGSIAIQVVMKKGRKFQLLGFILKQSSGIKDAFLSEPLSKKKYLGILDEMNQAMPLIDVSEQQFEMLLGHFLQCGLNHNNTPPVEVLLLLEFTNRKWEYPRYITVEQVEALVSNLPAKKFAKLELAEFVYGWASPDYAKQYKNEDELILHEFEPDRKLWCERLILSALSFAFELDEPEILIDVVKQLEQGKKMISIDFFQQIAFIVLHRDELDSLDEFEYLNDSEELDFFDELDGFGKFDEQVLQQMLNSEDSLPPKLAKLLNARLGLGLDHEENSEYISHEGDFDLINPYFNQQRNPIEWKSEKRPKRAVYQLKVSLKGSKPNIWRRIVVMNTVNLSKLHLIIQIAMGWEDCHLYDFVHKKNRFSQPNEYSDNDFYDSNDVQVRDLLSNEKEKLIYNYDFGDGWEHLITLEKVIKAERRNTPAEVIKGVGACPPEDVGGLGGYERMLSILKNPRHSEFEDMSDWLGLEENEDFDPKFFDIEEKNELLNEYVN